MQCVVWLSYYAAKIIGCNTRETRKVVILQDIVILRAEAMLAILRPVVVILREAGRNIMRVDGGRNIRNIATVVVIL